MISARASLHAPPADGRGELGGRAAGAVARLSSALARALACALARAPACAFVAAVLGGAALGGLTACGGSQHTSDGTGSGAGGATGSAVRGPPAVIDTRTPIEQRRDTACDQLGPKLTACAVEDARADLTAGKVEQQQFDRDTSSDVQAKNTEKFRKACKSTAYSSRQVRVLEVCFQAEAECGPLLKCLEHLSDRPTTKPRGAN